MPLNELEGYTINMETLSGGVAMREPTLRPPFCRQGNKYLHRKVIIPFIPPHKRYVELFVGSGAIFYNKEKAQETILNDLDKCVVKGYNLIKNTSVDLDKYRKDLDSLPKIKAFWDRKPNTNEIKIIREIIRTCYGFGGIPVKESKNIYKDNNPFNKLKRCLTRWKDIVKDARITNKDYGEIIDKYDSPDTFFFLDPPYENTNKDFGYAEDTDFDFERLAFLLKGVKSIFLMTINDSPYIRRLFKGFNIKPWKVKTPWQNSKDRKELLISNYPLKKYA
jgi:DNA adenine methylase